MSNQSVNSGRRKFLTLGTTVVGAVGVGFAAVPFLQSWNPSARAKAAGAPVQVDISKLESGQLMRVEWRGKPVWIVRRTEEALEELRGINGQLKDPKSDQPQQPTYATNTLRSIKDDVWVAVGLCTHLGCSPGYMPDGFQAQVEGIKSGFLCACHGSKFDLAGRVFQGVPAGLNLMIPPHRYLDDTTLLIGEDEGVA